MAEWLKAAVLKTASRVIVTGVRIPLPPPFDSSGENDTMRARVLRWRGAGVADQDRLLSDCPEKLGPWVRIPPSPPVRSIERLWHHLEMLTSRENPIHEEPFMLKYVLNI